MKKAIIALVLCLTVITCLTGCVKRKMKQIVGVYELSTYTTSKKNKTTGNNETTDLKELYHYESYYIFNGEGNAYYAVKSDHAPWTLYQVHVGYSRDEKKPKLVTGLTFTSKNNDIHFLGQGRADYISFNLYGSDADLRKSGITDLIPVTTTTIQYKKVSSQANLSKLFELIGTELPVLTYDLAYYQNVFQVDATATKYDYILFDIDTITRKSNVYYRETGSEDKALMGVDTVFNVGETDTITIGEFQLKANPYYTLELDDIEIETKAERSFYPITIETTIEDYIASLEISE